MMKKIYFIITVLFFSANSLFAQEHYIGEIRLSTYGFVPHGWMACNGQLLPIAQNQALFSILGTTYGGNGQTNFALPDLRGRVVVGSSNNMFLGQRAGAESTTLNLLNLPAHSHVENVMVSSSNATINVPTAGSSLATPVEVVNENQHSVLGYSTTSPNVTLSGTATTAAGSTTVTPINTMQPYIALSYIICLQGIFPSQN